MFSLAEVTNAGHEKEFLDLPVRLYKDSKYWVHPLEKDVKHVFDKDKNPCFKHGECVRWVLYDDKNECVGRVAAFVNNKTARLEKYTVGQMGFFECVNNQVAAFLLFDKCREWLEQRGMEAMEGPVNFGERLEWWGLLVDGFDRYPNYSMPYTHPYYVSFFEVYGFRDYFKQFTFRTKLAMESLLPMVVWKADRLLKDHNYSVLTYGDIGMEKAIDSLMEVYNKAWNLEVHGVDKITRDQVIELYKNLKPVLDEKLLYFAYYKGEPIGFYLMFPELNQAVRHLNGKMNLWGMAKFFYCLRIRKIDVALGVLFGVKPNFQGKGVEAAMIKRFCERVIETKSQYRYLEMNWIGDFNPAMVHLMKYIGGTVDKTHITYRKLFRDDIEFVRSADRKL